MNFNKEQEKYISDFIVQYSCNEQFRLDKQSRYLNNMQSLDILDIYILEEILRFGNNNYFNKFVSMLQENYKLEIVDFTTIIKYYGYDELNPIKLANETEIKETLANLLFGSLIIDTLARPEFEDIRLRQKVPGMIANFDKPLIIQKLQDGFSNDFTKINNLVDDTYKYIMDHGDLQSNFLKIYISNVIKYNTNVSAQEIFDIKNHTAKINYKK